MLNFLRRTARSASGVESLLSQDGGTASTGGGPDDHDQHLARVLHDRRHRLGRDWCVRIHNPHRPVSAPFRRPWPSESDTKRCAPPCAPTHSCHAGGLLGAALGPVFYAFETSNPVYADLPLRQQLRIAGRDIAARSRTWGRNFGVLGGLFSVSECFVAKVRSAARAPARFTATNRCLHAHCNPCATPRPHPSRRPSIDARGARHVEPCHRRLHHGRRARRARRPAGVRVRVRRLCCVLPRD